MEGKVGKRNMPMQTLLKGCVCKCGVVDENGLFGKMLRKRILLLL